MNFKKLLSVFSALMLSLSLVACGNGQNSGDSEGASSEFDPSRDFESIIEEAKGTRVSFYGWGGDENRNQWLKETVAPILKDKYDITLDVVGMNIDDILAKLSGEKQANLDSGSIDMIWINGENFYSAKENDLLFGPFAEQLPSFQNYVDPSDKEVLYDFGFPIEGYEAPYGKARMVLINDSTISPETPATAEEFMDYCIKHKGKVTYPALPDFTGSAFVRTLIYQMIDYEIFMDIEPDKEVIREAIQPALDYLRALNPYLWNEGKTFPATSGEVQNMFQDGELVLNMSYSPYSVALGIEQSTYTDTTQSFVFDKGTVGNTSYMAIAKNAPNKAGAMVAINEILSAQLQASQFDALKTLPVLDYDRLSDDEKALFDQVDLGKGSLSQDELLDKRLPEMPANIVPIIEEIWLEEVVGQ